MENIAQLEPNHDEDETVEEELDHFPKGLRLQAKADGLVRRIPAQINSGRNCRENGGKPKTLSQKVSCERRQERKGDLHWRIVQPAMHPPHGVADEQTE